MEPLTCLLNEPVTIGFAIFFLLYHFVYRLRRDDNKVKFPPGPRPWPLFRCLHLLGNLPHQSLTMLAKKYGPIIFLRLGSVPTVVVSSPSMAKEFLKTHDLVFASRPHTTLGKYVCYDHKDVAFCPYGAYWRQCRKLLTVELLTMKRIDSFRFVREEEVSAMVSSIWQESEHGAECVDVKKRLSSLTQNITCRMFAGRTYSDNDLSGGYSFKEMIDEMFSVASAFCIGDFIPSLRWLDLQGFRRRMKAVHKVFDGFAENVIDEHIHRRSEKGKPNEDRVKDMVDVLLSMAETENQTISRSHIKAMILDMLNAGVETSATLVEWAMTELLRNPATLARAQHEMECLVGRNRSIKESDVMMLDYLRCVVKETLRLHPPLPLLIPHESMEGCSVGGYFILESNKDVRGQDFELLPFGTGRRGCTGISMGLAVSELALAQLIHCFDWTVEGEVDVEEEFGLTVPRKYPLLACPKWRLTAGYPV